MVCWSGGANVEIQSCFAAESLETMAGLSGMLNDGESSKIMSGFVAESSMLQRPGGAQGGGEDSEILSDFVAEILGSTCSLVPPEIHILMLQLLWLWWKMWRLCSRKHNSGGNRHRKQLTVGVFFFGISVRHGHRLRDGVHG